MPSAFDLFGTLELNDKGFSNSVLSAEARLKGLDSQLDKTIAHSNKLGDTSATVARRYEKLGEGIETQRQRLLANTLAFEKGEINGKKFVSVLEQIDRATVSLNSRLKDAAARANEISETGFTHFQNQIKGSVEGAAGKTNSLFGSLSSFQKQQLSFQANDVISGLLSGQNPLQILAQQGGQIVQVFQQGKLAQEGTTVATRAAAAAEGELAVSAQATAAATTEASGAMTVFGASVVAVGATLAAAVAVIASAYKITADIRTESEKRLHTEEAIAGALNKQLLIATDLKAKLAEQTYNSQFGGYLKNSSVGTLQRDQDALQKQLNDSVSQLAVAVNSRLAEADRLGLTGKARTDYAGQAINQGSEFRKGLAEQIAQIQAQKLQSQAALPTTVDTYQSSLDKQLTLFNQGLKDQVQAQKEAERSAKELAAAQKRAAEEAKREAEERKRLIDNLTKEDAGRFDRSLDSYKLRREAREFEQGYKFGPQSVSEKLQDQLSALGASFGTKEIYNGTVSGGDRGPSILSRTIANLTSLTDAQKEAYYKDVVKVTDGLRPEELDAGQRNIAAQARRYLADKDDKDTKEIFKKLSDAISTGNIVTFKDESNSVKSIQKATPAATAQRY